MAYQQYCAQCITYIHVLYQVVTMVNKCSAFGCKSGYKNNPISGEGDQKVTFHAYPLQNKELCDKWIRANPRKDFIPSKHSQLCSLHFKPTDFVEIHNDSNK